MNGKSGKLSTKSGKNRNFRSIDTVSAPDVGVVGGSCVIKTFVGATNNPLFPLFPDTLIDAVLKHAKFLFFFCSMFSPGI